MLLDKVMWLSESESSVFCLLSAANHTLPLGAARARCPGLTGGAYPNQLWSIRRLGCQHSSARVFAIVVTFMSWLLDLVRII
ncbi:hypothetical protein ATANTOWER_007818 [Ataeniobius toweri]|uniref:Secreted protein n=1 Tax=Ataeniobius toweri TaxID=208326 RepID=A0ABU7AWL8_9TELE|nr:hypothetical protein [Ataeniobius toweri]